MPCWISRLGVPPSLCLLDLLLFVGFILLNWCLLVIIMNLRLQRGHAGCRYLHTKDREAMGFFTWVGMEGFALITGVLSNIMIGWYCVLPVSRRSVFLEMLGLSWESAIKYHRWIGFHTTFVTALHCAGYIAVWIYANGSREYDPEGDMIKKNMLPWGCADGSCTQRQLLQLAINLWGFGAFILMLVMVGFSLPFFRRRFYELFYFLHLLWIPMVVMAQLHCGSIYYLAPGLACHCVDKTLGLLAHFGSIKARVQRLGPDVVEIVVPSPLSYSVRTGQYILINVPEISVLQWHPLSVTWTRNDAFALHIRAAGDWTQALHDLASKSEVKVKVKGAYGKDVTTDIWGKDALVLWAGGLGLTYVYSVAEQASKSGSKVYLRFVVRTPTEERAFASLLDSLQAISPDVDIKMWITRPEAEDPERVETFGTATCSEASLPLLGAAEEASSRASCLMPMSSVVSGPMHALICGVAIFLAFLGLETASDVARNSSQPYLYPDNFYVTLLRGMLYPILFAMAGVVSMMLILVPIGCYVEKLMRARRTQGPTERLEDRQALQPRSPIEPRADPDNVTVRGCRPDLAAEWDSIATSLGQDAADVAVFVAGPNGLVDAVEKECGKRAWHVHRWHLDAEAWEW